MKNRSTVPAVRTAVPNRSKKFDHLPFQTVPVPENLERFQLWHSSEPGAVKILN